MVIFQKKMLDSFGTEGWRHSWSKDNTLWNGGPNFQNTEYVLIFYIVLSGTLKTHVSLGLHFWTFLPQYLQLHSDGNMDYWYGWKQINSFFLEGYQITHENWLYCVKMCIQTPMAVGITIYIQVYFKFLFSSTRLVVKIRFFPSLFLWWNNFMVMKNCDLVQK